MTLRVSVVERKQCQQFRQAKDHRRSQDTLGFLMVLFSGLLGWLCYSLGVAPS